MNMFLCQTFTQTLLVSWAFNCLVTANEYDNYKQYLVDSDKCKIPNINPWNSEILNIFYPRTYIPCRNRNLLTRVTTINNKVIVSVIKENIPEYTNNHVNCCCSKIERIPVSDNYFWKDTCREFNEEMELLPSQEGYQAVFVACRDSLTGETLYMNTHVGITITNIVQEKINYNNKHPKLSLLLIGIDSVSRLNMIRAMPQTYRYLQANNWLEMRGYNKIGQNTYPNWMGFLTGKNRSRSDATCLPDTVLGMNNCDLIWYDYGKSGYITAYAEDETAITTFNYRKRGFLFQPTDYYYRPYMWASEYLLPIWKEYSLKYCTGPETSGERIFDMAKNFAKTFNNDAYYGFFWANTFSHNNIDTVSRMDEKVRDFLANISQDLNNTIVFFISDHGVRYGDILKTRSGFFELNLPFFFVKVPEWFQSVYPQKYENLKTNQNRLTTPYDFFMTAQEILQMGNAYFPIRSSEACPQCKSLFSEVPLERSCEEAAIEEKWCTCREFHNISAPIPTSYI